MTNKLITTLDYSETQSKDYDKEPNETSVEEQSASRINFADSVARRIVHDFKPDSVLEVGYEDESLIKAFRRCNVKAQLLQVDGKAAQQISKEYSGFVKTGSILDSKCINRKFDLVICIEVLAHLQESKSDEAIQNLCEWSDTIIFTSNPDDSIEGKHYNVQQPGVWAEKFARNGFVHVLSYDAGYIKPWAQVFRREPLVFPSLARQYEDNLWIYRKRLYLQQELIVKLQEDLNKQSGYIKAYKTERENLTQIIQSGKAELLEQTSSREILEKEIQGVRVLQELHTKLQSDYSELQESYLKHQENSTNLQDSYSELQNGCISLQETITQLRNTNEQSSEQLQIANEENEKIIRTRAWKAVNLWWKIKNKIWENH